MRRLHVLLVVVALVVIGLAMVGGLASGSGAVSAEPAASMTTGR
jgi:hypothetical protein